MKTKTFNEECVKRNIDVYVAYNNDVIHEALQTRDDAVIIKALDEQFNKPISKEGGQVMKFRLEHWNGDKWCWDEGDYVSTDTLEDAKARAVAIEMATGIETRIVVENDYTKKEEDMSGKDREYIVSEKASGSWELLERGDHDNFEPIGGAIDPERIVEMLKEKIVLNNDPFKRGDKVLVKGKDHLQKDGQFIVEKMDDVEGVVRCFPRGGGFTYGFNIERLTKVDEWKVEEVAGIAFIDDPEGDEVYECVCDPDNTWNGWNQPWFTREVFKKIIKNIDAKVVRDNGNLALLFEDCDPDPVDKRDDGMYSMSGWTWTFMTHKERLARDGAKEEDENIALAKIQDHLGQTDGGWASLYFSDRNLDEEWATMSTEEREHLLSDYYDAEEENVKLEKEDMNKDMTDAEKRKEFKENGKAREFKGMSV